MGILRTVYAQSPTHLHQPEALRTQDKPKPAHDWCLNYAIIYIFYFKLTNQAIVIKQLNSLLG